MDLAPVEMNNMWFMISVIFQPVLVYNDFARQPDIRDIGDLMFLAVKIT